VVANFLAIQFSSFDSVVEFGMMRVLPSEAKMLTLVKKKNVDGCYEAQ